ncbi:MAG: electron transport complex subunit RsxA [Clostridia bacterium]|nr:electron transport complex subunit RsxA [Clostridia bacterium]
MAKFIPIILGAVLIENYVLVRFMGMCPFLGVSKNTKTAFGMGCAVIFTITISSAVTYAVNTYILKPLNIEYLQTIAFILVIAAMVQLVELALAKFIPALYEALGIYLPLITTNCAVLGSALLAVQREYNFIESVVFGFSVALGFMLVLVIFSTIRERIDMSNVPESFKGLPATLIAAALVSLAFMGFSGLAL